MIFARKMPEFSIIIARFFWGGMSPVPPSPTTMNGAESGNWESAWGRGGALALHFVKWEGVSRVTSMQR